MTNYDLTSIGAVTTSAKLAHIRANQEPDQSSYNAAWLRGYADALTGEVVAVVNERVLVAGIGEGFISISILLSLTGKPVPRTK